MADQLWWQFSGNVWSPPLQGGLLSPYLFALYINDLIDSLRLSGYVLYISQLFIGCLLYVDDIVLLSPSCFGLRHLISICEHSGSYWDIKFNPLKCQLMTFNGSNPNVNISMKFRRYHGSTK